jgi:hypothetical protein
VCKPKKDGGLGVKDLKTFNLYLLAKWRWGLLSQGSIVYPFKRMLLLKIWVFGRLGLGLGI